MNVRKLFSFEGRIGRTEFWGVTLGAAAVYFVYVLAIVFLTSDPGLLTLALNAPLLVVCLIVALAASVKRWHDRNKSGSWVFVSLAPIVGWVWSAIETGFLESVDEGNSYGAPSSGSAFAN